MKEITFEERFFKNEDEWIYFLSQCDIKKDPDSIYSVTIRIDDDQIEIGLQ